VNFQEFDTKKDAEASDTEEPDRKPAAKVLLNSNDIVGANS